MKKKLTALLLTFSLLMGLAACAPKKTAEETTPPAKSTENNQESTGSSEKDNSQAWKPEKDISFIVGFDAGGAADIPARVMAKYMTKYAGVNVTVANVVGSGGQVAAKQVLDTEPDGYTLLHVPVGYYLQNALGNAAFTYEDFAPVTMWCDSWVGIIVRADSPYKTYEDLIKAVRENPNTIKMGTVSGTLPQLAALRVQEQEDIEFKMVDLGSNNKATELLSGRVDTYIDSVAQVAKYVESGDFRVLMAFADADAEIPGYKDLPTAGALGYSNFEYLLQSFGMWMPANTDPAIVRYYADLIKTCAEDPECVAELNALGYGGRHEEPADYIEICRRTLEGTQEAVKGIVG